MGKKVFKRIGSFSTSHEDFYNPIDILKVLGYRNTLKVWDEIKSDDFEGAVTGILSYYKGKPKILDMTNLDGVIAIFKRYNCSCDGRKRKVTNASIVLEDTFKFTIEIK